MIYEYIANQISLAQKNINKLAEYEKQAETARNNRNTDGRKQAEDEAKKVRQEMLADAMVVHPFLEVTKLASSNEFRAAWQNKDKNKEVSLEKAVEQLYNEAFETPKIDLAKLLPYSFVVQFRFSLAQPYISRDEADFYIIDNPIRKDKVFGLPYIAPTSWKGSLRATLHKMGRQSKDAQIKRLFGNDKEVEEPGDLQAGRLYFFPTFFTQKSLEIINPHDRQRRVGKNPILIESVPIGADGVFTLLYLPFNSQVDKDKKSLAEQVTEDLKLVAEALQKMLCEYGFGAKTSSGFGLVKDDLKALKSGAKNGYIELNYPDQTDSINKIPQPGPSNEPESVKQIRASYPDEDFSFKPDEWREKRKASNSQRDIYKKARAALGDYKKALEDYQTKLAKYEAQKNISPAATTCREFNTLGELVATAKRLGQPSNKEGQNG